MLINIRGTNGSGKSTLVRRVMAVSGLCIPIRSKDKVIGYTAAANNLIVFGSYETATGGCDNFSAKGIADWVMSSIAEFDRKGHHVIFEGVLISMYGIDRLARLHRATTGLHIIELTTPIEVCEASIMERRAKSGRSNAKPFKADLVAGKVTAISSNTKKLKAIDIPVERLDREAAYLRVLELIGKPHGC
jgi:predicted kinase